MNAQEPQANDYPAAPQCVFILGITHRSGTNLLVNLLALHPNCDVHAIPEDFLTSELQQLAQYSRRVASHWNPTWGDKDTIAGLERDIGTGLQRYICRNIDDDRPNGSDPAVRRVVATKTPSVAGLGEFRRFFPDTSLVIVVRDGRAVVESGMRSFGWSFTAACERWASAARSIHRFCEHDQNPTRTLVVRYEDLIKERANTARSLFEHIGLDSTMVNETTLADLPVTGSSELINSAAKRVHWQPAPADAEFQPLERFTAWSKHKHARFNRIAGAEMKCFGYPLHSVSSSADMLAKLTCAFDVRRLAPRQWRQKILPRT